jgi:hypothetical protein
MYDRGNGVKQDDFKALKFYQNLLYINPRREQPPPSTRARLPAPVCSNALILLALMRMLSLPKMI